MSDVFDRHLWKSFEDKIKEALDEG